VFFIQLLSITTVGEGNAQVVSALLCKA
jgi:hypothetical protein